MKLTHNDYILLGILVSKGIISTIDVKNTSKPAINITVNKNYRKRRATINKAVKILKSLATTKLMYPVYYGSQIHNEPESWKFMLSSIRVKLKAHSKLFKVVSVLTGKSELKSHLEGKDSIELGTMMLPMPDIEIPKEYELDFVKGLSMFCQSYKGLNVEGNAYINIVKFFKKHFNVEPRNGYISLYKIKKVLKNEDDKRAVPTEV